MGDLHKLTTGPVSPTIAMIFATLGCLLSILLITRARRHTGWRRVRLVAYAIPALALPAVFLPALVTVLALRVDGSVLLLAPAPLGYSLAAAAGGTALAVPLLCFGRPGLVRQAAAGTLLVGAIGLTAAFLAASLTTGLPIAVQALPTGVALALTCVTGFGLATALAATRTMGRAVGTSALLGLSLATLYHVAGVGLTLRPTPDGPVPANEVVGLSPQRIGLPAIAVIAVVATFIWYFTLGTATVRDLRRMFEPGADLEEIEPWMIEQVRERVAHTAITHAPVPGWPDVWAREEPTVAVHAVSIVGRAIATAVAHRTRAALPASATDAFDDRADAPGQVEELTAASDLDRPDQAGPAHGSDSDAWPTAARNAPAAARLAGARTGNSRFGPVPVVEVDDRDLFASLDPDAWAERLRSLTAASSAGDGDSAASSIVHDYRAGAPLPQRNARPIRRP